MFSKYTFKIIFFLVIVNSSSITFSAEQDHDCYIHNTVAKIEKCQDRYDFFYLGTNYKDYGWFHDHMDELKDLVKAGKYFHASKLFNDQREFFFKKRTFSDAPFLQEQKVFNELAENLKEIFDSEIETLEQSIRKIHYQLDEKKISRGLGNRQLKIVTDFLNILKNDYLNQQILHHKKYKRLTFETIDLKINELDRRLINYEQYPGFIRFNNNKDNSQITTNSSRKNSYQKRDNSGNFMLFFWLSVIAAVFYSLRSKKPNIVDSTQPPVIIKEGNTGLDFWKEKIGDYKAANKQFKNHLKNSSGYFNNFKKESWVNKYRNLYDQIRPYLDIGLPENDIETIKEFTNYFESTESLRKEFNIAFVDKEIEKYKKLFDHIENRKLDDQQRKAIVTDEDNNLIIAGAGSGKTTTIVGKANYVIEKYNVKPNEILGISYTKSSANDLESRIKIKGLEVKTFHKFGLDIVSNALGKKPDNLDERQTKNIMSDVFNDCLKDESFKSSVNEFITEYAYYPRPSHSFKNKGEYYEYLKEQNIDPPGLTSMKGDPVKSIEECKIANFLLINGVDYKYEYPYLHDTATIDKRQYKPDFTIFQNEQMFYLEHFGINKDNKVAPHFALAGETQTMASKRYLEQIEWKRQLHKNYSTKLIETFSHEIWKQDLIFYEKFKKRLIDNGINLNPPTPDELWKIVSTSYKKQKDDFIDLICKFITLMKSNDVSVSSLREKNNSQESNYQKSRNEIFLNIVDSVYKAYEKYLIENQVIDFSDMIKKAASIINNGEYENRYKYILIDEFQDISVGRYKLLKSIKDSNQSTKLFCVGDDWQSIYRFGGSDIGIFKNFSEHFGVSEILKIEKTYRFNNPLLNLSSEFIQKNPNQSNKNLIGSKNKKTNFYFKYSKNDDTNVLVEIFEEIILKYKGINKKKITILGRHNSDLSRRVKNDPKKLKIYNKGNETFVEFEYENEDDSLKKIKAEYQTMHSSKGLEADIVILINLNNQKLGMPNKMSDDKVLNLVLSDADQYEHGEERRLFYVAMTRTKSDLYLVSDIAKVSPFVKEISSEESKTIYCPICKEGFLIPQKSKSRLDGRRYVNYICSNKIYRCNGAKIIHEDSRDWIEEHFSIEE